MSTKEVDIKVDIKYTINFALNLEISSRRFFIENFYLHFKDIKLY
jgi:hypothetical protein